MWEQYTKHCETYERNGLKNVYKTSINPLLISSIIIKKTIDKEPTIDLGTLISVIMVKFR